MVLITLNEAGIANSTFAGISGAKWSENLKPAGREDSGEDGD